MGYHVVVVVPRIGGWRAHLPDFPGCRADASYLESAVGKAALNAVQSKNDLRHRGLELPAARTFMQIRDDAGWANKRGIQLRTALICWVNLCD